MLSDPFASDYGFTLLIKRVTIFPRKIGGVCNRKVCIFYDIFPNYKLVPLDEGTSLYRGVYIIKFYSQCIILFISILIKVIFVMTLVQVDAPSQRRTSFNS